MFRKARHGDIDAILQLINFHAEQGQMLFRARQDICQNIDNFLVIEKAGELLATCSLKCGWDRMVEIRSLAVQPDYYRQGLGTALVHKCVEEARGMNADKIFVLTYAMPLFAKLGFEVVDKGDLPLKIWSDCHGCMNRDHCDETAMLRDLHLSANQGSKKTLQSLSHRHLAVDRP